MIRIALPAPILFGAFTLMGCAQTPPPTAEVPGVECSADKLGGLVGKMRGTEVEAEARRLSGAKTLRWLAPDSMATMDFRVDRLNLYTDAQGNILRTSCG